MAVGIHHHLPGYKKEEQQPCTDYMKFVFFQTNRRPLSDSVKYNNKYQSHNDANTGGGLV
jgi:hypothetical protein